MTILVRSDLHIFEDSVESFSSLCITCLIVYFKAQTGM